jgi:hypothetical protein
MSLKKLKDSYTGYRHAYFNVIYITKKYYHTGRCMLIWNIYIHLFRNLKSREKSRLYVIQKFIL